MEQGLASVPAPPDAATIEAWAERQRQLARQVRVPLSELYQVSPTSVFATAPFVSDDEAGTAQRWCGGRPKSRFRGAVDESFVHESFLLPEDQLQCIIHCLDGKRPAADATEKDKAAKEESGGALFGDEGEACTRIPQLQEVEAAVAAQLVHDIHAQQQHLQKLQQAGKETPPPLTCVAGLDISFIPNTSLGVACLAIFTYPELRPLRTLMHHCELTEPYLSGFLAFREVQPVLGLFARYEALLGEAGGCRPQLLFVDGCGVHHPRRCGLASHLGVLLGMPTIGCAKKMLSFDGVVGRAEMESCFPLPARMEESKSTSLPSSPCPIAHRAGHGGGDRSGNAQSEDPPEQRVATMAKADSKGSKAKSSFPRSTPPLHPILGTTPASSAPPTAAAGVVAVSPQRQPLFGYALLTTGRSAKKCIFISPGNKIGFAMAVALVISVCRSRIPEPIREADLSSRQYIREGKHKAS